MDLIDDAIYKDFAGKTAAFMRASSVQVLLTDRHMQKIRKKGGENSRKYLGKRLVKQLARKAALARWGKGAS